MQQILLILTSGILTGVFALLGVILGPWLKARNDLGQWWRERQLEACAELYRAVMDLLPAIAKVEAIAARGHPGEDGELEAEQVSAAARV